MQTHHTHQPRRFLLHTAAVLGVAALTALGSPALRAQEKKGHDHAGHTASADVPIPATAAGVWTEINGHQRKLADTVAARKLAEADPHIDALDALLAALPGKSTDLPEAKQKTVTGMVKNADTALDALHEAAEAGKQDVATAKLKQFDAVLKILRAQYPADVAGAAGQG